jgi:ATP-dependent helicase/nuclease subunit B
VLQAIHRLSPREEPEALEELDPLQRGSLVHEVQFELHERLREAKLLPITHSILDRVRTLLDEVLDEVAARFAEELAPAIPRVWADGIGSIRTDLREWLRRAADEAEWTPTYFELSFGLPEHDRSRDPQSTDAPVTLECGINLRGSIDLVETARDGALRATDYKTGKARVKEGAVIQGGDALQPVLYALALEKLLPESEVREGRLYYFTSAGDFTAVTIPLDTVARESAALVARLVDEAIASGFLPASPKEGACTFCDYVVVCGPDEERRVARKPRTRINSLLELRKRP